MSHFWLIFFILSFVYGYPTWAQVVIFLGMVVTMYSDCFTE